MTATTTTRTPASPGRTAPKLVWTNEDGIQLNWGKPMTGHSAAGYVRRNWDSSEARVRRAGVLETWPLGAMTVTTWRGTLPVPGDLHGAVRNLLLDLPFSVEQGDLLIRALDAVADSACPDCPVCAPLRQLLATTAVTR